MDVTFNIKKAYVYDEVSKLTSYIGAKTITDTGLGYDRVFTTDDDRELLERFWREACISIEDEFKNFITSVTSLDIQSFDLTEIWSATLSMPSNYDTLLDKTINDLLVSYCINSITAKWLMITSKDDASTYMDIANQDGLEIKRLLYNRKKPVRKEVSL